MLGGGRAWPNEQHGKRALGTRYNRATFSRLSASKATRNFRFSILFSSLLTHAPVTFLPCKGHLSLSHKKEEYIRLCLLLKEVILPTCRVLPTTRSTALGDTSH